MIPGNRLIDGFGTLERGMDSGRDPSLLPSNQVALAINATMRGGFVQNRPGYRKVTLTPDVKALTSITHDGLTATAISPIPHQLRDGDVVTISGVESGDAFIYNITAPVTIVDEQSFSITSIVGLKWARIARLLSNGDLDSTCQPGAGANGEVFSALVQSDGKVLIAGTFTSVNGTAINRLARLTSVGPVDFAFNLAGAGADDTVRAMALQSDGKIVIAGNFLNYNGTSRVRIARVSTTGALDVTFAPGTGANGVINTIAIQADGKILIGGDFTNYNGTTRNRIARLNADGTLDFTFDPTTGANGAVNSIGITSLGLFIVGGDFTTYQGISRNRVVKVDAIGGIFTGFRPTTSNITSITRIGNIATVTCPVAHALTEGAQVQIQGATGGDATLYNIIGTIHVVSAFVFTYTMLGTPSANAVGVLGWYSVVTGFCNGSVKVVSIQTDNSIMLGGDFTAFNAIPRNRIARMDDTGVLDTTFDPGNGANGVVRTIQETADHSILIGGDFTLINDASRNRIARLYANGGNVFNPGTGADDSVNSVAVQTDGKFVVAGDFTRITTQNPIAIVTLNFHHAMSTGDTVIVSGATGSDAGIYNGSHLITVLNATQFTYALDEEPAANATGTLIFSIPIYSFTYQLSQLPTANAVGSRLAFSSRTPFEDRLFQGACYYKPPNAKAQIAMMVGGQLFLITPKQFEAYAGTISNPLLEGGRNNSLNPQAWLIQAEMFLIVQDGSSAPIIWDGATAKRSDALGIGVPTGRQMAYGMGRLWIANGREYVAGDIVNGPSGTPAYAGLDAILYFTENTYLNGGGAFQVPLQSGNITAMQFLANLDTALGQQELLVLTEKAVFSVNVPIDRTIWQNLTTPLQRVAVAGYGALGFNSVVAVNSDLFYRSHDGIRSVAFARRDFGQWGSVPQSNEMVRILSEDDQRLLGFSSGVNFDNRLLMTCGPARANDHGVYHRGLISLDFNLISSMAGKQPPAYDGLWTGVNVLQIIKGDFGGSSERCFMIVLSPENKIELWEISKTDYADRRADNDPSSIQWSIDGSSIRFEASSQQLSFANGGLTAVHTSGGLKRIQTADIFAMDIKGRVTFSLSYSPDRLEQFSPWATWDKCANIEMEEASLGPTPMLEKRGQYRSRMRVETPAANENATDNKPMTDGFEFQPRLEITGSATIYTLRLQADPLTENPKGEQMDVGTACTNLFNSNPELFSYSAYAS